MHSLTKTLWIVIFMLLITETATIIEYILNKISKENKNEQKTNLDITLRNNANIMKKVKLNIPSTNSADIPFPFVFLLSGLAVCLVIFIIRYCCPYWLFNDWDVPDIYDYLDDYSYRRDSQFDQSHVQQLNHYQDIYKKSDEPIEDERKPKETY